MVAAIRDWVVVQSSGNHDTQRVLRSGEHGERGEGADTTRLTTDGQRPGELSAERLTS